MRAQRLSKRKADERGAVGDLRSGLIELRVGEQHEPGTKRGPVRLVFQPHLCPPGNGRERDGDDGYQQGCA
jgi:hypothetical protein